MKVIILGGTSAIAEAVARRLAGEGASLLLAGRRAEDLGYIADDLKVVGAGEVKTEAMDLAACPDASAALKGMCDRLGGVEVIFLAYGLLGDQRSAERDLEAAKLLLRTNFSSPAEWILAGAGILEEKGSGSLVVIGSVAGDRGRQSNYLYGAAKGGLALLMQGLTHKLSGSEVVILTVKPGFVDTPMTAAFKKGMLWASVDAVAGMICKAIKSKKRGELYVPWFWRWIMVIIRNLPNAVLHRTKL